MKTLLVLLVSILAVSANATSVKKSVIQASDIRFERVKCPPGKVCAAVVKYKVVVTYGALGCLDTITATAKDGGTTEVGTRILKLRGVNHRNPKSATVKCAVQPFKKFEFDLGPAISPERVVIVEATR